MKRRIVIKIGSNVLTRQDGKLDVTRMSALVDQIAWLRKNDIEVILVSSGAVACGRRELTVDHSLDSVEQRQLFSAVGQVKLVGLYYDLFREFGIHVGQVLTMKENFEPGEQYRNQRACMTVMLENNVLPIVNENDTVSVTELMFTDNDELSGLIAQMMRTDTLILLSNIDGIYDGHPDNPAARIIPKVEPGRDLSPTEEQPSPFSDNSGDKLYVFGSDPDTIDLATLDGKVQSISIYDYKIKTTKGIGIGSTEEEVLTAYGNSGEKTESDGETDILYELGKYSIDFFFDRNSKVITIIYENNDAQ